MVWLALHDCAYTSETSLLDPYLGAIARQSGCSPRPPTASRPGTAQWSANAGRSSNAHLLYSGCPLPDPTVSDELFTEDDSSDLTHGNVCFLILFFPTPPPSSKCFYCWWKPGCFEYHPPMPLLDQIQHIFSSMGLTCSSMCLTLFPPAAEGASHLCFALLSPSPPSIMCSCPSWQPHAAMVLPYWSCLSHLINSCPALCFKLHISLAGAHLRHTWAHILQS